METIRYGMKIALDYNDDVQPVTINPGLEIIFG